MLGSNQLSPLHPYFPDEKTEAQRGLIYIPRVQNQGKGCRKGSKSDFQIREKPGIKAQQGEDLGQWLSPMLYFGTRWITLSSTDD
jgi:hypothetical protein